MTSCGAHSGSPIRSSSGRFRSLMFDDDGDDDEVSEHLLLSAYELSQVLPDVQLPFAGKNK